MTAANRYVNLLALGVGVLPISIVYRFSFSGNERDTQKFPAWICDCNPNPQHNPTNTKPPAEALSDGGRSRAPMAERPGDGAPYLAAMVTVMVSA